MRFLSKAVFGITCLSLCACSVWQSEGRKFLEKQAFEYTGADAYLVHCVPTSETTGWSWMATQDQASVFQIKEKNEIRIIPHADRAFSCDYRFSTSSEMGQQMEPAIANTWAHFHKP